MDLCQRKYVDTITLLLYKPSSRYPRLMDLVPAYPSISSSKLRFVSKAEYPARGTERKMS